VNQVARGLATFATAGGALLVLLLYVPALQAPFLAPKFSALEMAAALGLVAFALQRAAQGGVRWSRGMAIGAWLVLLTTAVSWVAAARGPLGGPYAADAMARWVSLFGMACASSIAETAGFRGRVFEAVSIASAAVAVIGLLQHGGVLPLSIPVISMPGSTFGNRNPAAEAMAMALPFALGAAAWAPDRESRVLMIVSVVLELLFLAATRARGAWIGAVCGLATVAWLSRARVSRAGVAAAMGAIVIAGVAASVPGRFNARDAGDAKRYAGLVEVLQESVDTHSTALRTRLGLWRRTVAMIAEHPLLGVGPGNWPVAFPQYAEPGALRDGVLTATRAPRQAHDDPLERFAETGLPGLLALGLLGASTVTAARRRLATGDEDARSGAASAVGSLVALAAISFTSFPLEMPATIALAGIALGFLANDGQPASPRSSRVAGKGAAFLQYATVAGALLLVAYAGVRAERRIRGSRWLAVSERALHVDRGTAGASDALAALRLAVKATPVNYRADLRASQMLLRLERPRDAALAAKDALAIEPRAPNAWAALAAADLEAGDAPAARRDADEALRLLHDDPFALHVRVRAFAQQGDSAAAEADESHLRALANHCEDADTMRAAKALLDEAAQGRPRSSE
jgi:O-antigen ligase